MSAEYLYSFLIAAFVVFSMSAVFTLLAVRPGSSSPMGGASEPGTDEESSPYDGLEELAEQVEADEELLSTVTPLKVPHIELPGALAGGGATAEACSKTSGVITLDMVDNPDENREYDRRMRDRRSSEFGVDQDRRLVERRILLRRDEDLKGKQLLTVTDAADTLGVPVERIYQWLDKADIPFYQVAEGKSKAIRFEINELLQWYSAFCSSPGRE
jgi:excisionase family DNA binding protein